MRCLRLVGLILFAIALSIGFIWLYEEFSNNFNYYYNHQFNFDLLVFVGILTFGIGLWLMLWEKEPKKQNHS